MHSRASLVMHMQVFCYSYLNHVCRFVSTEGWALCFNFTRSLFTEVRERLFVTAIPSCISFLAAQCMSKCNIHLGVRWLQTRKIP